MAIFKNEQFKLKFVINKQYKDICASLLYQSMTNMKLFRLVKYCTLSKYAMSFIKICISFLFFIFEMYKSNINQRRHMYMT